MKNVIAAQRRHVGENVGDHVGEMSVIDILRKVGDQHSAENLCFFLPTCVKVILFSKMICQEVVMKKLLSVIIVFSIACMWLHIKKSIIKQRIVWFGNSLTSFAQKMAA